MNRIADPHGVLYVKDQPGLGFSVKRPTFGAGYSYCNPRANIDGTDRGWLLRRLAEMRFPASRRAQAGATGEPVNN